MKSVHFMGIGGSGMSAVAVLAQAAGYKVTGCDLQAETPYLAKIRELGIPVAVGHNKKHLEGVDLLAATPAAFFQSQKEQEFLEAKKQNKLMTWQCFLGRYLQKGKRVICIAGTHGKSTTTALSALLFTSAGFDPSVMIGATVREWGANYRVGKSKFFIVEADEFYDNFLNYAPETIVLNNIEMDHPDYFKSEEAVIKSFRNFILRLTPPKNLIFNQDSQGVKRLFARYPSIKKGVNLVGYCLANKKIKLTSQKTIFEVDGQRYWLKIPGEFNVANALGVIALAKLYGIDHQTTKKVLAAFQGIGRRLERLGQKRGVVVYDDYAHHPTAIAATLSGLRQRHPKNFVWLVVEPHTYSRTKALLPFYKGVFGQADRVVVAPIFKSRDTHDFGVSERDIVKASNHQKISNLSSFAKISHLVSQEAESGDVIIVMGAGKSHLLAREILASL